MKLLKNQRKNKIPRCCSDVWPGMRLCCHKRSLVFAFPFGWSIRGQQYVVCILMVLSNNETLMRINNLNEWLMTSGDNLIRVNGSGSNVRQSNLNEFTKTETLLFVERWQHYNSQFIIQSHKRNSKLRLTELCENHTIQNSWNSTLDV